MKIFNVNQGTKEWATLRSTHNTASEAPAMMGVSKYQTRSDLLHQKSTGISPEIDGAKQRLFNRGHDTEAAARLILEGQFGEDLMPITAASDIGNLLASMDGMTMDGSTLFEHKLWGESLAAQVRANDLEPHYYWQLEQQLLVSGADRVIFVCSDGTVENWVQMEYQPVDGRAQALLSGWLQFDQDLADYKHTEVIAQPTGRAPETLPALLIEISGAVQASNLAEFHGFALSVFKGIKKELNTDEDFANAEQTVRWCGDVESRLEAAKQHALSQTASIDALFRTIDDISAEARRVRLDLAKLVEARKLSIKGEIVADGVAKLRAYIDGLNATLGKPYMPAVPADFGGVIKGKRSVTSIRDAVATELARTKIAASDIANRIQANLNTLREQAKDHKFLFSDASTIVLKQPEDLQMLVKSRIAEHQAAEAAKEEATRARIRAEEVARIEAANRLAAANAEREGKAKANAAEKAALALVEYAPVATNNVAPITHEAVVALMPATVRRAMAPKEVPTMTLGSISERLGFNCTSAFLATLGFEATTVKAAKLYCESSFPDICRALIEHIESVCETTEV